MADSSMDIVSNFDKQEIANAVNSSAKEVSTRYDFKNIGASVELSGETIAMQANSEERVLAILDGYLYFTEDTTLLERVPLTAFTP